MYIIFLMYIILLNKLRFDLINYSGRSGTRWQYGVPKWYEIVKRLGTPGLKQLAYSKFMCLEKCKKLKRAL